GQIRVGHSMAHIPRHPGGIPRIKLAECVPISCLGRGDQIPRPGRLAQLCRELSIVDIRCIEGLYHGWFLDYLEVVGEPDPAGDLGGLTAGSELLSTRLLRGVVTRSARVW